MLALIFPGQGSQRPQMGVAWRHHPSWSVVDTVSEVSGRDVAELLLEAPADVLRATSNAQLATFALSLVILDAAQAVDLSPGSWMAVAGHSLGEYSALVAGGALSLEEGAQLVLRRGEAMQAAAEAHPGTMAAVLGLTPVELGEACAGVDGVWVANDNAPGQVVLAGTADGVANGADAAIAAGAKRVLPLPVGGAFHCPLMDSARPRLAAALANARFEPAAVPVVTNFDAHAHQNGFPALLEGGLVTPVRWRESLQALELLGAGTFVELGPATELSGMVRRTLPDARRANVATPDDLASLSEILKTAA